MCGPGGDKPSTDKKTSELQEKNCFKVRNFKLQLTVKCVTISQTIDYAIVYIHTVVLAVTYNNKHLVMSGRSTLAVCLQLIIRLFTQLQQ